jgi:hypothetical protein
VGEPAQEKNEDDRANPTASRAHAGPRHVSRVTQGCGGSATGSEWVLNTSPVLNAGITALVITLRFVWPALIVLGALSVFGVAAALGLRFPPLRAFVALIAPSLILVVWGGINWAAEQQSGVGHWRSRVLDALGFASVALMFGVPWLYRREPRWWLLIPSALAGIALILGAWVVSSMAISNVWL